MKRPESIWKRWFGAGSGPRKATPIDLLNYRSEGTSNTGLNWSATQASADSVIKYNLWQLRDKSRALETNNPTAERIFKLWESNIFHPDGGMTLQMQVKQDREITLADGKVIPRGAPDAGANKAIEDAWYEFWNTRGHCDVSRELTGIELDKLILRTMARDGVALIRLVRGFDNPWKFALQVLEVDQLDLNYNEVLPNGNEIRMSIEVDRWGHRVAAYLSRYEPGDWERSSYNSARSGRINRIRIPFEGYQTRDDNPGIGTILIPMRKRRPGQTLDLPWLTPVMDQINSLDKVMEAEITAWRASAEKMGFLKATVDAEGTGFTGVKPDARHTALDSAPGSIQALDPGWEFQGWDPKHPNANIEAGTKVIMRNIGNGVSMSYGSIANDRSDSSFSAERSALNDEREEYKHLQGMYAGAVRIPIFGPWLLMALTMSKVKLDNGSPLPLEKFDKFNHPYFQGRRWGYINPLQDAQAFAMLRDRGWMSDRTIIAQGGGYIEDTYAEIRSDLALAQGGENEAPLTFGPQPKPMPERQTPERKPEVDKQSND